MGCDAECVKIIIDTGMGAEAARLYAGVIKSTLGVQPIDSEAPLFYARVAETTTLRAAQALNEMAKLKSAQRDRLMAQIDKQCYRADELISWAQLGPEQRADHAAAWTTQIFDWVKEDQVFYTELAAEVGEGSGKKEKSVKGGG